MPILASVTARNNTTNGYHVIRKVEITGADPTAATVYVAAYPSEAIYLDPKGTSLWLEEVQVPLTALAQPVIGSIEQWLVTGQASAYAGGTIIADKSIGIDGLRVRKWAEIKNARQAAFDAPLVTPFGTFDSDADARDSIKEGVLLVNNLVALGMPSGIRFTLADNSRITLTASQMVEVGLLLGAKIQAAYDTADALRTAIGAATQESDVAAVVWPVAAAPAAAPAPAPPAPSPAP